MWIGYDDPDRLITYPDAHNLSGCSQPIHMRSLIRPRWPIFGCFHSTGLQFDDYTASSRGFSATKRGELHYMRVRHADDARPESFM